MKKNLPKTIKELREEESLFFAQIKEKLEKDYNISIPLRILKLLYFQNSLKNVHKNYIEKLLKELRGISLGNHEENLCYSYVQLLLELEC